MAGYLAGSRYFKRNPVVQRVRLCDATFIHIHSRRFAKFHVLAEGRLIRFLARTDLEGDR